MFVWARIGGAVAMALAAASLGCAGAAAVTAGPLRDVPVPADAARAEVVLRVDLRAETRCEEAFDLALYADLAIDLVQWDAATGACADRVVTIRYLSSRANEAQVIAAARSHAVRVSPVAASEGASRP